MAYGDRVAAWQVLLAAHRAQNLILTTAMSTVALNTITAQQITDINAAIVAIAAAVSVGNAALTRPD